MRRLALLSFVLAAIGPAMAEAAPCSTLTNPVFLQVGDTQVNLLRRLGRQLANNTPFPITIVFKTGGSCDNVAAAYADTKVTGNMDYIPSTAEDAAWDPTNATTSPTKKCDVVTQSLDVVNSALFISSCNQGMPSEHSLSSAIGPVQAYALAVPEASTQTAITFEEAYFVFGFGSEGMIVPWDDQSQHFIRPQSKSTLLTWALNLSIPSNKIKNMPACTAGTNGAPAAPCFDGSGGVVTALKTTATPEKAVGLLGVEVYDAQRDTLNILAYKSKGQYFAYYPDSTATSRDKLNVRDGHYTVWSPTEWMQKVDGAGAPLSARANYVINVIVSRDPTADGSPEPNFDPIPSIVGVGLVPDCAMRVQRAFDGGNLSLYTPSESCTCEFEALTATSSCQTCANGETCSSGVCRKGFCEAF